MLRSSGPRVNPRVTSPDLSYNVGQPGGQFARRVIKGGSHLCAPNYCHGTGPRPARRRRSRHRWATSAFGASSVSAADSA